MFTVKAGKEVEKYKQAERGSKKYVMWYHTEIVKDKYGFILKFCAYFQFSHKY